MKERVVVNKGSALIIDDDRIQGEYLKHMLKDSGLYPVLVDDPEDFIAELKEEEYDIIFIDYLMPKANGLSVYNSIKSELGGRITAPVILLDNDITESFGREVFSTGFTNYLEKPVDRQELDAVLYLYLPPERVTLKRERQYLHERDENNEDLSVSAEPEVTIPDFLYKVDGMDVSEGLKNCGSAESFLSAVELFYNSIEKKSGEIEEFYKERDIKNYTIWVHALKSSARIVGIGKLSKMALSMEEAGNAEELEKIDDGTGELLKEYRSYLDKLKMISQDSEAGQSLPPVPPEVLADAYDSLSGFIDAMDYDLAEMVLSSMKEYSLPEDDAKRFKSLGEKLLDLDWDGMKALLAEKTAG